MSSSPETHLPQVVIVSTGSPELANLAVELANRGMLARYVHPFAISDAARTRGWARGADRIPRLARVLDRRRTPVAIPGTAIQSATPVLEAFRTAVGTRWPAGYKWLIEQRNRRLGFWANRLSKSAEVLVVSHGVAHFVAPDRHCLLVLNMPSCHPAYRNAQFDLIERDHPETTAINRRYPQAEVAAADIEFLAADAILCGSNFAARTLAASGVREDKLHVIPYGVDAEKFHAGQRATTQTPLDVISVGTVTPAKGILDVVAAFASIPESVATLELVGEAPHGLQWLDLGRAQSSGRLDHSAVAERMRQADLMILASWFEGLSLSVLEALACGLPCIVTERGPDQVVRHGIEGFVVPVGSPNAVRSTVLELAAEPARLSAMRRSARRRAEELSWGIYAAHVIDLLCREYEERVPMQR